MKILKYAFALMAFAAMTCTFSSCSKDVDKRQADKLDGKGTYEIAFTLSNPGSLTDNELKALYLQFNDVVYGEVNEKEFINNPMYCTSDYAWNSYNAVAAIADADNDIVQEVLNPIARQTGKNDFEVTMSLQEGYIDNYEFVATGTLASKTYRPQ